MNSEKSLDELIKIAIKLTIKEVDAPSYSNRELKEVLRKLEEADLWLQKSREIDSVFKLRKSQT